MSFARRLLLMLPVTIGMLVPSLRLPAQLLKPTKTDAVVVLTVVQPGGMALTQQKLTLTSSTTQLNYFGTTDFRGRAELLVPAGDNYVLNFPQAKNFAQLSIPKKKFYTFESTVQYDGKPVIVDHSVFKVGDTTLFRGDSAQNLKASYTDVLLRFSLTDYEGHPLDSETITLRGLLTAKYYKGITGKNGQVQLLLPKGEQYDLSFAYEPNIDRLNYPREAGYRTADVSYQYLGSREMKRRIDAESLRLRKASDDQIAANKKEFEALSKQIDLYATLPKTKPDSGNAGKPNANDPDSILIRAAKGFSDPVVLTVLQRHDNWSASVVVTDLTGSMSPYTEQLAVWFREQLHYRSKLNLFFFNDGDGKADEKKVIGATGGIHACLECTMQRLDTTVKSTMSKGNGGDGPENDVEAIIKAVVQTKTTEPVILIADNKAPVKDISLAEGIHVPVHVILCGAADTAIHPDYLRLALITGGSLHTTKGDFTVPATVKDGQTIELAGYRYVYSRNRFLLLK